MTDAVTNASCEPSEVQFTQQELFDLIKEHTKQFEVFAYESVNLANAILVDDITITDLISEKLKWLEEHSKTCLKTIKYCKRQLSENRPHDKVFKEEPRTQLYPFEPELYSSYEEYIKCIKAEQIRFDKNRREWKTAQDFENERKDKERIRQAENGDDRSSTLSDFKRMCGMQHRCDCRATWVTTTIVLNDKMTLEMYDHNSRACIKRINYCKQMIANVERP
jgi:hypothetical protein